jgi:general stress protein 26
MAPSGFLQRLHHIKLKKIGESKRVSIAIAIENSKNYLMILGSVILVNYKKKKELWSSILKACFTLGLDDPDMTLIKASTNEVTYWDSRSAKW